MSAGRSARPGSDLALSRHLECVPSRRRNPHLDRPPGPHPPRVAHPGRADSTVCRTRRTRQTGHHHPWPMNERVTWLTSPRGVAAPACHKVCGGCPAPGPSPDQVGQTTALSTVVPPGGANEHSSANIHLAPDRPLDPLRLWRGCAARGGQGARPWTRLFSLRNRSSRGLVSSGFEIPHRTAALARTATACGSRCERITAHFVQKLSRRLWRCRTATLDAYG